MNQGLGDHIALAGACVKLAEQYPHLIVPHAQAYTQSLRALFDGYPIMLIPYGSVPGNAPYINIQPHTPFGNGVDHYTHIYRDMLKMDPLVRWTYCPLEHNRYRSQFQLAIPNVPYAFVHDDQARRFTIDNRHIRKGLRIVTPKPQVEHSILAYCMLIEYADEVHVIDSAFFHLTEQLNPTGKLFLHRYARHYVPVWMDYFTRHDWRNIVQ